MSKTIAWAEGTFTNMAEPFTVMLTNEAQQFATDSNRKVTSAQSYYTDIIVIRGSQERTDYTIGTITSGSGITVSKNSKRVTFSVSAGTTIGADAGVIEIPITLDGQTVKKQFSWSCGKQGSQGVKGEDGKTSYFHVKYSNDGGKTFTGNSGEDTGIYIGSYTDYTEADSTDVSKYTWVKVAGDNFSWNPLIGSSFLYSALPNNVNFSVVSVNNIASTVFTIEGLHYKATASNGAANSSRGVKVNSSVLDLKVGDTIALSCDIKGSFGTINNGLCVMHATTTNDAFYAVVSNGGSTIHPTSITDWTRKSRTYTIPSNIKIESDGSFYLYFFFGGGTGSEVDVYVRNVQIEKGNVATPWTPNPDDLIGEKGQDGTSVKITSKSVTYQASTSGTTTPTGTWSTSVPTVNNGQYLWTKTTVQYSDGNKTEAYSVSYKGTNGTNGTSVTVSKTEVTYQVSTSGTTAPTGTWSTTMPACDQGLYLWTKTYVKYSDGKDTTSYAVSYKGIDGKKFAFNMLRGTNQGSKHWETHYDSSVDGKYSVESFVDEDGTNGVKFICTEKTSRWQYVCFIDYEMIKTLKSATKYVFSCDIKTNVENGYIKTSLCTGSASNHFADNLATKLKGDNTWEHVVWSFTTYDSLPQVNNQIVYLSSTAVANVGETYIKNLKLTEGTVDTPWAPHPEDLEGRGVSETVQYYLATSQSSGVTSSTSGWSTDITTQKLTADKKYLWNCYQTKYSDGTSEPISTPKVIGVYGDKGANALQCKRNWTGTYTTINSTAVATLSDFNRTPVAGDVFTALDGSSNTGTWQVISVSGSNVNIKLLSYVNSKGEKGNNAKNLSITPSSQYFKSTDGGKTFAPNTITIKPTIQGEISFGKWQYSIDGGVSFADVVSGQKGLTISNNVLSVSKDSSLYSDAVTMVTFRAVANDSSFYDTCSIAKIYDVSDIGDGRNLIQKTQIIQNGNITLNLDDYSKNGTVIFNTTGTNAGFRFDSYNNYQPNSKYVLSYYFTKTSGIMDHFGGFHNGKGVTYTSYFVDDKAYSGGSYSGESSQIGALLNDGKRHRIVVCYTTPSTIPADTNASYTYIQPGRGNTNPNFGVKIEELKLEKGSSPTGWSPAPEDLQTAILSTKSEISSVSSKVDQNTKSIQNKVENTTYQNDLKLVKGDIAKANEGLNKWRYEIYPKSLFATDDQSKSTMDVFAKNKNLVPSRTVLLDDTDLGKTWGYGDNYIAYAVTFVKMSSAKSVAITFKHDDGAHLYLNGKLIGGSDGCNTGSGHNLSLSFVKGWNCLEVVLNEITGGEYIGFGTTVSTLTECELMNCYYAMVTGRESQITNTLVQTVTDLSGVTTTVGKVTGVIGEDGGKFTEFKNDYSNFKQSMDGFKTTVSSTYVTKNDFDNLEIGGRNLLLYSQDPKGHTDYYHSLGYISLESEIFGGSPVWSTKSQWGRLGWNFKNHVIDRGFVNVGDTFTYSLYVKTNNTDGKNISCSYRFQGNSGAKWFDGSTTTVTTSWRQISATFSITEAMLDSTAYLNQIGFEVTSSMSSDDKVYFACPKLEKGNKPTGWTPAPEDVDGQITTVESETKQLADRFSWIVKSGTSASNMTLTDRMLDVIAQNINLTGKVTFSSFDKSAQDKINGIDQKAGNAATAASKAQASANNAKAAADKAQSSVDGLEIGGRNLLVQRNITQGYLSTDGKGSFIGTGGGDQTTDWIDVSGNKYITITLYEDFTNTNNSGRYCEYDADKNCINTVDYNPRSKSSIIIELKTNTKYIRVTAIECKTRRYKIETGNKATDWTPAPEDISQDATTKANQALTDAKEYAKNSVDWVTSNGQKTQNLYSMVSKWAADAISDTTEINGGLIKSNTILARHIAADSITSDKILAGSVTADKINVSDLFAKNITASGTIQSNNYAESNGAATAGSKWILSDGSFKSKNLSWDASGNINAAGGQIGKYTITGSYLITGSGSACTGIGGNQAFWAGSQSSNEAPFRVSYGGQLVASGATLTNAIVSGDITATKGQIGGWNITSSGLFTNDPIIFEEEQDDGTIKKVFDERFNAKVLYNSSTSSNTFMFDKFCNTFVDTSNVQYDDSDTLYTATSAYSTLIDQGCIDIHESMYCPDVSENHDWNYNYHLILTGNRIEFNEYTLDGMYKYMPDEGLTSIGVSDITTGSFKCDQIQVGGENVTSIIGRSDWIDCDYGNGISNYEDNTWNQVQVRKVNGIVFLRGVMQNSTTWQTHDSIFTFPKEYAPEKESRFVMQGSGSNRWLLVVRTSGICKAERYSNNTTMNNTVPLKSWLNVYASWPAR